MPAELPGTTTATSSGRPARFGVLASLIVLVAFALREHFVLATIVDVPIRGDVRDYVFYAWNLVQHNVFSNLPPQQVVPPPDAYRSPGYPWLLALSMELRPHASGWYPLALQLQVLAGTATVLLAMLLARHWLRASAALLAGLLLALWPHHVAATGVLLPEVVFGLALVAGLYCLARGWVTRRRRWFAASALVFGYAFLVNPLIALFPPCLAAGLWLKRERAGALILFAVFLLPVALLALRNAQLQGDTRGTAGRAAVNFVQGSWPLYHAAANRFRTGDRIALEIMEEIDRESALLQRDPVSGLAAIGQRFGNDPSGYARWYLWDKPWLLWDWQIRVGASDLYFLQVRHSPLETIPLLRTWSRTLRAINPLLSGLALAGALGLLLLGWRRDAWVPAAATGAMLAYFTVMHALLQAEPRYAVAYRGLEMLVVVTVLAALVEAATRRRDGGRRLAQDRIPA